MSRPVKGCKDLFEPDILKFNYIIDTFRQKANIYSCSEIKTPILEHSEVFSRSLGEFSDVVNKEMYSFIDQGDKHLTLRPEFTAAVMRAVFSNGLQNQLPLRLFSYGPLFRRENPQSGRQRQFHQINVEFLGFNRPYSDAEAIKLASDILEALAIKSYTLEINSLGCDISRQNYQKILFEYFNDQKQHLSEISKTRLEKNPLRILDSKDENDKELIVNAPKIHEHYTAEAKEYFEEVLANLDDLKIKYVVNPSIVRGLDYYSHTAFEFVSNDLGAQSTIIAGGRYDGLSKIMGNTLIPAVGFAGGIERLMLLTNKTHIKARPTIVIALSKDEETVALQTVDVLRVHDMVCLMGAGKKVGDIIQKAVNKHNAQYVVIIGGEEVAKKVYTLKNLDTSEQKIFGLDDIIRTIQNNE
jgi:histidyl-tRNA synthetase